MFLECNATAPDGSDKKTGVSEQPASFKQPLTSPPASALA